MLKNKAMDPFLVDKNYLRNFLSLALISPAAWAHEGHGLGAGSHWHASDGWGWIVGLAVVAMLWGARKP